MKLIFKFFEVNIIKTVLFNLRLFSIKEAIRFPVIIYGRYAVFHLLSLKNGQIEVRCPCKTGIIRLNRKIGYNIGNNLRGTLFLQGKIVINGECDIGQGCNISIREGAVLEIDDKLSVTGLSKIHVYESIKIGKGVVISWNVQIHDTDYHYFIKDERIFPRNKKIEIGDNIWIGHDVTISKGSVIPSNCIIASNSLVNGRYYESGNGLLLAGIPAKLIRSDIRPINNYNKDSQIDTFFKNNLEDIEEGVLSSAFD